MHLRLQRKYYFHYRHKSCFCRSFQIRPEFYVGRSFLRSVDISEFLLQHLLFHLNLCFTHSTQALRYVLHISSITLTQNFVVQQAQSSKFLNKYFETRVSCQYGFYHVLFILENYFQHFLRYFKCNHNLAGCYRNIVDLFLILIKQK